MTAVLAAALGWLAGAAHLGVTAARARHVTEGQVGRSLVLLPLGLLAPVVAVLVVIAVEPASVWAVFPGLLAAQLTLIGPLGRRLEAR